MSVLFSVEKRSWTITLRARHNKNKLPDQTPLSPANAPPCSSTESLRLQKFMGEGVIEGESVKLGKALTATTSQPPCPPRLRVIVVPLDVYPRGNNNNDTIISRKREQGGRSWRLRPIIVWCCCHLIAVDNNDDGYPDFLLFPQNVLKK